MAKAQAIVMAELEVVELAGYYMTLAHWTPYRTTRAGPPIGRAVLSHTMDRSLVALPFHAMDHSLVARSRVTR